MRVRLPFRGLTKNHNKMNKMKAVVYGIIYPIGLIVMCALAEYLESLCRI